ncbi:S-layer homology domain-containing protein [bacterium]|nr:S-layer homology domain-containing protein [bacterium]
MKKIFTVLLFIAIFIPVFSANYTDLPKNHWAYGSVQRMSKIGIFKGIVKNGQLTFQGSKSLTRYEFSVAMDRLLNNILKIGKQLDNNSNNNVDLSDENFKLQSNLLDDLKSSIANLQVEVNMNKNSINKTIIKVKELENRMNSQGGQKKNTLFYLSVGSFVISMISLIIVLSS